MTSFHCKRNSTEHTLHGARACTHVELNRIFSIHRTTYGRFRNLFFCSVQPGTGQRTALYTSDIVGQLSSTLAAAAAGCDFGACFCICHWVDGDDYKTVLHMRVHRIGMTSSFNKVLSRFHNVGFSIVSGCTCAPTTQHTHTHT